MILMWIKKNNNLKQIQSKSNSNQVKLNQTQSKKGMVGSANESVL